MKTFKQVDKVYIKSNNTTNKIFNRYLFCLIPYILLIIIYNLIWGDTSNVINLLIQTSISIITICSIQFIINIIKKEKKNIINSLIDEKLLTIALIIGLFSVNSNFLITIIGTIAAVIAKNSIKNITISSALYGLLIITILNYFNGNLNSPLTNLAKVSYIDHYNNIVKPYGSILSYSLGLKYYLSPVLSVLTFIYLFYKKSIKYNIVASYLLVITITMLSFGLLNNMNIWYLFFQLTTGNILFLIIFLGTDYPYTPTTGEGQFLYGLLLGIITSILRFIIPEVSVILTLIIGPIILTKFINTISFKLRYNKKYYHTLIALSFIILLLVNITINIII